MGVKIDINSEGRADMRTTGWENWRPSSGNMSQNFGAVTVTLRAVTDGGSVSVKGSKRLVVNGITLGADGVHATGSESPAMEVQLEGIAAGRHSFVGYHHSLSGESGSGTYTVSVGERQIEGIKLSKEPRHNDDLATSFRLARSRSLRFCLRQLRVHCSQRAERRVGGARAHGDKTDGVTPRARARARAAGRDKP